MKKNYYDSSSVLDAGRYAVYALRQFIETICQTKRLNYRREQLCPWRTRWRNAPCSMCAIELFPHLNNV
eukprot:9995-Heterococcus_DN1.PRE.1